MTNFIGTEIFWITIIAITVILSTTTIIGRGLCRLFPFQLRPQARFYLSPSLGLASLMIVASISGRYLPMRNSVLAPILITSLLVWSLLQEQDKSKVLLHAMTVSVFGAVCGISILGPLYFYGGFNTHNDAFTYLAHSNWLQNHAFGDLITSRLVTPSSTQIFLYQQGGYRMGSSFLLALFQALSKRPWSYEIYPSVIIAAMTACFMGTGFAISHRLRYSPRYIRLALLSLPAFGLGSMVFGANLGFLPQTFGLAFGSGLVFMIGALSLWLSQCKTSSTTAIIKATIPAALLFSASVLAYSELAPFLVLATLAAGLIVGFKRKVMKNMLMLLSLLFGLSALLLNMELLRAYFALKAQSGTVVGTPVAWPLSGFLAHALGVHGGAWDLFQWSALNKHLSRSFIGGWTLMGFAIWLIAAGWKSILRDTRSGLLLPTTTMLLLFFLGFLYFRYGVASPFPTGKGQSWSQFKLVEWANPFLLAIILGSAAGLKKRFNNFNHVVVALFAAGLLAGTLTGIKRIQPLMHYYSGVKNLDRFYKDFRVTVLDACPNHIPVFLSLNGEHHKFRQMAALYLYDKELKSNWTDDGYIFPYLPENERSKNLEIGNCVVEPIGQNNRLDEGKLIGPFRIGISSDVGHVRIKEVAATYIRESDGKNWWYWVDRKISFRLEPHSPDTNITGTHLVFEFASCNTQTLTIGIVKHDGSLLHYKAENPGDVLQRFDKSINLKPSEIAAISVETDGRAFPIGNGDDRIAAFMIRNLTIEPVHHPDKKPH